MKKYFFFALFLVLALPIFAQPKIEIDGGFVYDFGTVKPEDSPLKTTIKIKNTGTENLKITEVRAACGCTTAPLSKDELQPGETADLAIELRISTFSGEISKSVMLKTNDPDRATHNLVLKANVMRPFSLSPRFLSFNKLIIGEESNAQITINNETPADFKITELIIQPEDMKINLKKGDVIPANQSFIIDAKYTPSAAGRFNGTITIKTNNPDAPEIEVRGWGRIVATN
jgi:hypothetical protein